MRLSRRGMFGALAAAPIAVPEAVGKVVETVSGANAGTLQTVAKYGSGMLGETDIMDDDCGDGHMKKSGANLSYLKDRIDIFQKRYKEVEENSQLTPHDCRHLYRAQFSALKSVSKVNRERMLMEYMNKCEMETNKSHSRKELIKAVKEYIGVGGIIDWAMEDYK